MSAQCWSSSSNESEDLVVLSMIDALIGQVALSGALRSASGFLESVPRIDVLSQALPEMCLCSQPRTEPSG